MKSKFYCPPQQNKKSWVCYKSFYYLVSERLCDTVTFWHEKRASPTHQLFGLLVMKLCLSSLQYDHMTVKLGIRIASKLNCGAHNKRISDLLWEFINFHKAYKPKALNGMSLHPLQITHKYYIAAIFLPFSQIKPGYQLCLWLWDYFQTISV